jgi:hypothetical protein
MASGEVWQELERQTRLGPHAVPSGWFCDPSQTGEPLEQSVMYCLQGSGLPGAGAWPAAPSQAAPVAHATHAPVLHTWFAPQVAPSVSGTFVSPQAETPVAQEVAP